MCVLQTTLACCDDYGVRKELNWKVNVDNIKTHTCLIAINAPALKAAIPFRLA
jgi:hypothetical protein